MIEGIKDSLEEILDIKREFREVAGIPNTLPFSAYPSYISWQDDMDDIPTYPKYFDFTKDRYSKLGEPCGFRDIGDFTRDSPATVVDGDTSYTVGVNVPRISKEGLLLEPESLTQAQDILTIYIGTGEYISGDWDAGVKYEQFTGYAVYKGSGFIRVIEVMKT